VLTPSGTALFIRPIRPDDAERLVAFHERLSPQSVYFRFFSPHPRLSSFEVERFTNVDYADRLALVAEVGGELVGIGRYDRICGTEAEIAFVVADAWQHHGIATVLLELLADAARANGFETFVASTLPDNHEMIHVLRNSSFPVTMRFTDGVVTARFPITPRPQGNGPR
jgi:RimJ/RimL family protein N-acetyltransferase